MTALPVLPDHDRLDLALRQAHQRGEAYLFSLLSLVEQAHALRAHEHFGFPNAAEYLQDRLGQSHRSVQRLQALVAALQRVPEADRESVRADLLGLGLARTAIVAPALGREGIDWPALVKMANASDIEAVQARVSIMLGIERRKAIRPAKGGVRETLMRSLPPDVHEEVGQVFDAIMAEAETDNETAVVVWLFRIARKELESMGRLAA